MREHGSQVDTEPVPGASTLRSGALAQRAGVSTDTLRHYERMGVLPAPHRASNGYREYAPQALERVMLVRRALTIGFTLAELAAALRERDRNGSPCRIVRALAADKLARVERELTELAARWDALRSTLGDWDRRLTRAARGHQARLLDHVITPAPLRGKRPSPDFT